jgi:hypothetical protein
MMNGIAGTSIAPAISAEFRHPCHRISIQATMGTAMLRASASTDCHGYRRYAWLVDDSPLMARKKGIPAAMPIHMTASIFRKCRQQGDIRTLEPLGSPVGPNSLQADVTTDKSQAQGFVGIGGPLGPLLVVAGWRWTNRYGALCTRRNPQASIRHRAGGKGRMPMLAQIRSEPQAARQRGSRGGHATATTANRPPWAGLLIWPSARD